MSEIVISARNVGKQYLLFNQPQDRLKHALAWRFGKSYGRPFRALHEVSFDIRRGESVGIVGRNGSGKSTLLQILVGTLQPTTGEAHISGRVGALLELGSGFNPDYTGRENVHLNGALLGLSPADLADQFEAIAAFADIGEFMDQPVRLYSSGMVMRLAFAVQAMVPKDILIVDEALAVGDEAFQRKCYARLDKFRDQGGTVLLVSHNTQTIVRQCDRCLFLNNGRLIMDGPSKPVTDIYQRFIYSTPEQQRETLTRLQAASALPADSLMGLLNQETPTLSLNSTASEDSARFDHNIPKTLETTYGNGQAEIFGWGMYTAADRPVNVLVIGKSYIWRYQVRFHQTAHNVKFGMMLKTVDGLELANLNTFLERKIYDQFEAGQVVVVTFKFRLNVAQGTYYLNSGVMADTSDGSAYLHRRVDICAIRVIPFDGRSVQGLVYLEPQLEVRRLD